MKLFILVCVFISSFLQAGFLRSTSIMFTCASSPPTSPPSCSTIYYLVTAVGLFSGEFNFNPSFGTEGIHSALLSGQVKTHNPKHTDLV